MASEPIENLNALRRAEPYTARGGARHLVRSIKVLDKNPFHSADVQ